MMPRWTKRISLILPVALLLLLVAGHAITPPQAPARAGGGGGFSGGGGGFSGGGGGGFGGGGFSSGGGSGSSRPMTSFDFVIILIVVLIIGAFYLVQSISQAQRSVITRARKSVTAEQQRRVLAALAQTDPAFSFERFEKRVTSAFQLIQKAWSQQELAPMRPFVSDGIFERFSLQIQEQLDMKYRNVMDNVRVISMRPGFVERDNFFDILTVEITASATDYRVSLLSGKEIPGFRRSEKFVEYWSFLRSRNAKSKQGPGLMEGCCPNCSAPVEMNQSGKCESCDALLRSGEHDWVLCEITQASEWSEQRSVEPASLTRYRQTSDPGINTQHLEDRASVIFWRRAMADRLGDTAPLAKMAISKYVDNYQQQFTSGGGPRTYPGDCAVGSVETLGLLSGEYMDIALVLVRWSASRFTTMPSSIPKQTGQSVVRRTVFLLGRRKGVKSQVELTTSSAHCPQCGAPEENLASHACEACGEVLNDGSKDWVLTDALPLNDSRVRQLIREAHASASDAVDAEIIDATIVEPLPADSDLLVWTIKMALADNHLDSKEERMLKAVANRRNIPQQQLQHLIEACRSGELEAPSPRNVEEGRRWMTAIADASLWDGRVDPAERDLLVGLGASMQYSTYDVDQLIRSRRARMYKAARDHLRNKNGNA